MTQNQTVEVAPSSTNVQYRLDVSVVASYGIERELFVFDVTEDKYQHVATVGDMRLYPSNRATALANDVMFYRSNTMSYVTTNQIKAANAAQAIQGRLKLVNAEWGALDTTTFGGVETFVYDSGET